MKKIVFSIVLCFIALLQVNAVNAAGPWNGGDPKAFISQAHLGSSATKLTVVTYNSDGSISLNQVGDTSHNVVYNALAFNTEDNYLYAIVKDVIKTPTKPAGLKPGDVVRIANDASLTYVSHISGNPAKNTAAGANAGAFNTDDNSYYVWRDNLGGDTPQYTSLFKVSLTDGSVTEVGALSQRSRAQDFTYLNGYFWALQRDVNNNKKANLVKVDPNTAQTTIIPLTDLVLAGDGPQFGAAWTLENNGLMFSNNDSGNIYQIVINDDSQVTNVRKHRGPANDSNDGASMPGVKAPGPFVNIEKEVDKAVAQVGDELTYTIKVKNDSEVIARNYVVTDTIRDLNKVVYLENSITINGVNQTDALDDDYGSFVDGDTVKAVFPTIDANETMIISFKVKVLSGAAGTTILNSAVLTDPDDPNNPLKHLML